MQRIMPPPAALLDVDEVEPLPEARRLIEVLEERGHAVVLASSAKSEEVDHYLDLLDARSIVEGWKTPADVEHTKPDPDLVAAAKEKAGGGDAVMLGDSTWDCIAAARPAVEAGRRAGRQGGRRDLPGERSPGELLGTAPKKRKAPAGRSDAFQEVPCRWQARFYFGGALVIASETRS